MIKRMITFLSMGSGYPVCLFCGEPLNSCKCPA